MASDLLARSASAPAGEGPRPGPAAAAARPRPWWRTLVIVVGWSLVVLSCSGLTSQWLFDTSSVVKYLTTVVASLLVTFAAASDRLLFCVASLLVAAAPFSPFAATFFGISFKPIYCLLVAAGCLLMIGTGRRLGPSQIRTVLPFCGALMIVPFSIGDHRWGLTLILASGLLVAWIVARVVVTEGPWEIVAVLVATCTIQAAIAVYEYRSGNAIDLYSGSAAGRGSDYFFGFDGYNRSTGTFYDPIALGNVLAASLPLLLVLLVQTAGMRRYWRAVGVLLVGLLIAAGSITTLSRMSWVGATCGLILCIALLPRRAQISSAVGILVVGLLGVRYAGALAGPALAQRLASILHPTGIGVETANGDEVRRQIWAVAKGAWEQHPITGVGFGDLPYVLQERGLGSALYAHAHSTYFQIAATGGLLMIGAVLLLGIAWARDLAPAFATDRLIVAGVVGSVLVLMVGGLTDTTVLMNQSVMTIAGTIFGLGIGVAARSAHHTDVRIVPDDGAVNR